MCDSTKHNGLITKVSNFEENQTFNSEFAYCGEHLWSPEQGLGTPAVGKCKIHKNFNFVYIFQWS